MNHKQQVKSFELILPYLEQFFCDEQHLAHQGNGNQNDLELIFQINS